MKAEIFLCPKCRVNLIGKEDQIVCGKCNMEYGLVSDGIFIFHGTGDKVGFFDKQSASRLAEKYSYYSYEEFKESLKKRELFEMDQVNKKVGIARKLWWEDYIGKIKNSSVLEVGCGVNYLVPYWLDCHNEVTAFDICKESVVLLKNILQKIGMGGEHLNLFVGDAEQVVFDKRFALINVNNVLHHIENKKKVLIRLRKFLTDDGKMLIVEPNYYYPFRWIIETNFLDSINFVKAYFVKHDLIEKGEKAIVFRELKNNLREVGFKMEVNIKDNNFLGYGITYFIDRNRLLSKLIYNLDRYGMSLMLPHILAPFEYLILSKA